MIKLLFPSIALVASSAAFALDNSGIDAALKVCQGLIYSSDKTICMEVVTQAKYIDKNIPAFCETITNSDEKIECLRTNSGALFSPLSLKVCSSLIYSSDKVKCAGVLKNKEVLPAALSICESITGSDDKINCLAKAPFTALSFPSERVRSPECSEPNYLKRARAALRNFEVNNMYMSGRTLQGLVDLLEDCAATK